MATIRVDLDRRIGAISPLIHGSFIEHLGRCIYDGIVAAERAAQGEYAPRADTLDAVRGRRVPILRWPAHGAVYDNGGTYDTRLHLSTPHLMKFGGHSYDVGRYSVAPGSPRAR